MASAHGSDAMLNRVMTNDNIGIAALLELIDDNDTKLDDANGVDSNLVEHNHEQRRTTFDRSGSLPPSNDSTEWPPLDRNSRMRLERFHGSIDSIHELGGPNTRSNNAGNNLRQELKRSWFVQLTFTGTQNAVM